MYEFEQDHNNLIPAQVTPTLQVNWSQHRAWHGDTVKILVRTQMVNDGTKVKLEVKPKGGTPIESFTKDTVTGNTLDKDYKIDWKKLQVPEDSQEFVVTATLTDFNVTADSDSLFVDLVPPLFSV